MLPLLTCLNAKLDSPVYILMWPEDHTCMYEIKCPKIWQNAPISALMKPIGLWGTITAQKMFRTPLTLFDIPPTMPKFRTSNNVGGAWKFFCVIMVPQSPIGLISTEIGALCRILGHANVIQCQGSQHQGIFLRENWGRGISGKSGTLTIFNQFLFLISRHSFVITQLLQVQNFSSLHLEFHVIFIRSWSWFYRKMSLKYHGKSGN